MANKIKNHYLNKLISHLKMNSKEFSESLGYKRPDRIYHILNGRNGVSSEVANDICRIYDNVDYNWLMTGIGDMLKKESADSKLLNDNIEEFVVSKKELWEMLKNMEKTLSSQQEENLILVKLMQDKILTPALRREVGVANEEKDDVNFANAK
ncbi:MAG: helix-turn-helix domain-containing protein [Bacteroidales bacterium]|jgi:plasmid maintenance system antidote protein VapI|nr:helix-turn-helix domain-containing protein [Bacteroidales bacterium]